MIIILVMTCLNVSNSNSNIIVIVIFKTELIIIVIIKFFLKIIVIPGFKSYKILLNKCENPSTHSSQDLMEILDTILQRKLKFSFILLMILVFL